MQRFFRNVKYITLVNLLAEWDKGHGVEGMGEEGAKHVARTHACGPRPAGLRHNGDSLGATAGLSSSAEWCGDSTLLDKPAVAPVSEESLAAACDIPSSDEVLFPEYLTCEDRSAEIAAHVVQWLSDEEKRQAKVAELAN